MYVRLRQGDRLPTVALAQARLVELGLDLDVDGDFGRRTHEAVRSFQDANGLDPTGEVDPATWSVLARVHSLVVVDHIDATAASVLLEDGPYLRDGHSHVEVSYGMSRGLRDLIGRLLMQHPPRSVALLRFHGHGGPGHMVVTSGTEARGSTTMLGEHMTNPQWIEPYALLGSIMKPYGSIELHGCRVGARANGERLLRGMADACGVPVSAALGSQYGGRQASRFEGTVATHCPRGESLSSWSRRRAAVCDW